MLVLHRDIAVPILLCLLAVSIHVYMQFFAERISSISGGEWEAPWMAFSKLTWALGNANDPRKSIATRAC